MNTEKISCTDEQIAYVKNLSLSQLASSLGYTVVKTGAYYHLKEMDSLIIYNDRTWNRWSGKGNIKGGTTIDFLIEYGNLSINPSRNIFTEAVHYLLEYSGYKNLSPAEIKKAAKEKPQEKKEEKVMIMPEKNPTGYKRAYAYLIQQRGISTETINYFVKNNILYEDAEHHNLVFVGYDKDKNIKFATKRGTSDTCGYRYRGDVKGNNKNYGVNIVNKSSDELNVFEASIDMMSFCDIMNETDRTNKLALSMLDDAPLETFLRENPNIKKINLYLDNDEPGRKAAEKIKEKYQKKGYGVKNYIVPEGKDVNEYLMIRRSMEKIKNAPRR